MLIINKGIDLSKSFDKLKLSMEESKLIGQLETFGYMQAYFNLEKAVDEHIKECTGNTGNTLAADPDDLKNVL